MKSVADDARGRGMEKIDQRQLDSLLGRYDEIMGIAMSECPVPADAHPGRPGRKKKGKERSLIERLVDLKDSVTMFVRNLAVPFDNNQAERDVRYIKVKAKVSGCFRDMKKAQEFLDVESYIGTARKNGIGVLEALRLAFAGKAGTIV